MAEIKLYLDEDIFENLAPVLRNRKYKELRKANALRVNFAVERE